MAIFRSLGALMAFTSTVSSHSPLPREITPLEGCPAPRVRMDSLTWFNGSKALRCWEGGPDGQDGQFCQGGCDSFWCDPTSCTENGGKFMSGCYTGLPSYQPWGYGPPPNLTINFVDLPLSDEYGHSHNCGELYKGYRDSDPGMGFVHCEYAENSKGLNVQFYGNTNFPTYNARITYDIGGSSRYVCANGSSISASGELEFELTCQHDQFNNATCTAGPLEIPMTAYRIL